jgi:hypothetical protein
MPLGAGDCERLHDGLIAQPVNTASALAYVAVGTWLLGRRQPVFGLAVAAAGIGSVDYHGPGSPAARLLHDGGLYAVAGYVAWHEVARRVGQARQVGTWLPWTALPPARRGAYLTALAAAAAGAACWWAGRTSSPWCRPDSVLQPHAAWHLLSAAALAAWTHAVLGYAGVASNASPRRR